MNFDTLWRDKIEQKAWRECKNQTFDLFAIECLCESILGGLGVQFGDDFGLQMAFGSELES